MDGAYKKSPELERYEQEQRDRDKLSDSLTAACIACAQRLERIANSDRNRAKKEKKTKRKHNTNAYENIGILGNYLYNAIMAWYNDNLIEYNGFDDEKFIKRVCEITGMTENDYRSLMLGHTEDCSWNN